jgi:hypothetical protein
MPREVQTAVQVANMALRIMQAVSIESFDEETLTAQTVRMYYDVVLRRCLTYYPWAFCKKEGELPELPESPLSFWQNAYHLPADFVDLRSLHCGIYASPVTRPPGRSLPSHTEIPAYEIVDGNIVCCNYAAPIFAEYTYEAPVEYYPHYFLDLLVSALVEELSAVFGYNLAGQDHYRGRVLGPRGKLGDAILQEKRRNAKWGPRPFNRLAAERNW